MKKPSIMAILMFWSMAAGRLPAEEIDRLLAAVNGRVITEGDLKMARSLNALYLLGRSNPDASREQEVSSLIDLELIRQEMENFPIGQSDQSRIQSEVQAKMEDLKSAYAEIGGLPALLRQLGLQDDELLDYLRLRALVERFIYLRFRPFIPETDPEEMQRQKASDAMDQWIANIRNHSRIEFFTAMPRVSDKGQI
jgi:hypothetical protein